MAPIVGLTPHEWRHVDVFVVLTADVQVCAVGVQRHADRVSRLEQRRADLAGLPRRDTLRLARPALITPASLRAFGVGGAEARLISDGMVDLTWSAASGIATPRWDVWFSPDAGREWTPLALGQSERMLLWAPPALADSAMIEIVGRADGRAATAFLSDPFRLMPRDSTNGGLPIRFALRLRGGNPVRDPAALQLALPVAGALDVAVFDVTGARVKRLASGSRAAGFVALTWDLKDDQERAVRPGIYFVRASALGRVATLRLAVLR